MKALNVLIRCDASVQIGLGHVTRCLVLAKELKAKGHNVYFALKDYELGIQKVTEQGFQYFLPPMPFNYHQWVTSLAAQLSVNIFIGDVRDGLAIKTIESLKQDNILTVAIDEPSDYRKACDLCFYPPHAQLEKLDWAGFNGEIKQGLEYVLLRPEFYIKYRKKNSFPRKLLVMMGGTDPYNISLPIVKQLLSLKLDIDIIVLISTKNQGCSAIEKLNSNITIINHIENMAFFLHDINFAVVSFGVSAYEFLAMQVPTLQICLNEDHWQSSQFFVDLSIASRLKMEDINNINESHFKLNSTPIETKKNKIIQEVIDAIV